MTSQRLSGRIAFRNILCAVDFSPISGVALAYAVAIAKCYGAKVYVGHVVRPELYTLGPLGALPKMLAEIDAESEQRIEGMISSLSVTAVPHEPLLRCGDVVEVLMELSKEYKIDLLVVGSQGRRGFRKLVMGSVAEQIMRRASCPVLTVGPRSSVTRAALSLKRILYATDFSEESLCALPFALSLSQEFESCTVLAHVVPSSVDHHPARRSIEETVTEHLRGLVPEEATLWSGQEYRVDFGDPVAGILRAARERQVDLIVMGARGYGAALNTSDRLGATADSVASCAPCPVLTAHSLGPAGTERADCETEQRAA